MKLWAMHCRATQDGQVTVECSDKTWSTVECNGKPIQYSCLENPMSSMKRQKDRTLKDELSRLVGDQYAIQGERRNNSRKNEEMEPKQKQCPVVNVNGDGSKVPCCKSNIAWEHGMLAPWIKVNWKWSNRRWQVNIDITGISELKWTAIGKFNSNDQYIYYCEQESLRRNGVALIVNKRL